MQVETPKHRILEDSGALDAPRRFIGRPSLQPKNSPTGTSWLIPVLLIGLNLIPDLAGVVRLLGLASGELIRSQNARFMTLPLPVSVHIVSASLFGVIGVFQFWPRFLGSDAHWHRLAGRIMVPCGMITSMSGLWMNQFYPYVENDGFVLCCFRLIFGFGMLFCLVFGLESIRWRDFDRHRNWMMRGYAIGLGAGTQALTQLPWVLIVGMPGELPRALLMGAAWIINLLIAEWIIRGNRLYRQEIPFAD
jgi:uncharacterized membrane protein